MRKLMVVLIAILFVGCAYITSTDSQDISVKSNPSGAKVIITTTGGVQVFEGQTPASAHLKKKNKYVATVSMQGYADKTVQIDQEMNTIILGNLLCGGIPGLVVDGVTGAMWNLTPDQIVVTLQVASLNDGPEKLYAFVSWLDANGQTVSIPVEMVKL